MPQLELPQVHMIEMSHPTGDEDLEDVFIPTKSAKVVALSGLFADDAVGDSAEGPAKREEGSGQTHQILGKALTLSLGTESGYETEGCTEESDKWQHKPLETWTSDDVMDWIYNQANLYIRDLSSVCGENFQQVDGQKLCEMREEDFVARDSTNGSTLFRCLQDYKAQRIPVLNWHRKNPFEWSCADVLDWIYYGSGLSETNLICLKGETFQGVDGPQLCSMSCAEFEQRDQEFGVVLFNSLHCFLDGCKETKEISHSVILGKQFDSISSVPPSMGKPHTQPEQGHWVNGQFLSSSSSNPPPPATLPQENVTTRVIKSEPKSRRNSSRPPAKRPRKTRVASCEDASDDDSGPQSKTPKQSSKTRLWKFMRDLLDNPEYNPECIRWENKDEGIFRIVAGRSKIIADLWGKIKNNPTMTFDKLGRSLRWCRANNGKFSAVPRDGKFPRKLCFRLVEPDAEDLQITGEPGKRERSNSSIDLPDLGPYY